MEIDLTKGRISKTLFKLTLPIALANLIEIAYNATDIYWVSRLGAEAVTSVSIGGYYLWIGWSFILIGKVGSQILIAQSAGVKDEVAIKKYTAHGIYINALIGFIFLLVVLIFSKQLISLFPKMNDNIFKNAQNYILICSPIILILGIKTAMLSLYNGIGNSKIVLYFAFIGVGLNIVLDPVFIYVLGFGVSGAAMATLIANLISLTFAVVYFKKINSYSKKISLIQKFESFYFKKIFRIGFPIAMQSLVFALLSTISSFIIGIYGPLVFAAQSTGAMIESIVWNIGEGLNSSYSSFVGQNFSSKHFKRIRISYNKLVKFAFSYGIIMGFVLYFGAPLIYLAFDPKNEYSEYGIIYLQILAFCQPTSIFESVNSALFSGLGKTNIPAINGILNSFFRLVLIYVVTQFFDFKIAWLVIVLTAILKSLTLFLILLFKKKSDQDLINIFKKETQDEITCY